MDIETVRARAQRAISPLKAADASTCAPKGFLFNAKRTDAGRTLPPYYLVYFLLVDLLGFKNLGQFEKVAWSVPVEYDGQPFLVEHRKFGLGVFAANVPEDEAAATEIVRLIHKATKAAQPYFDWRAEQAAKASKLNVVNRSPELFERLNFYLDLYDDRQREADARKAEKVVTDLSKMSYTIAFPSAELYREAKWLGLSAIECFFSWTEHVFIHIAILRGSCATGEDVAKLAKAEWSEKFKAALDIADPTTKRFYDQLAIVRRQLRNFVAHGAFGKDGEAFHFHSTAGAVPMLLPHRRDRSALKFGQGVDFVAAEAIALIRDFIDHLWSGPREPAKIHIQDYGLPLNLTKVVNGDYARAMASVEAMESYADYQAHLNDRYANMDF
ncbi:hypothetical protein [Thalassospira indica]|uniref:hypothetical protein n=1 Tax=Thalassospira indica TaxID=1891279 RepID=UPI0007E96293|nr:hypothetical protein [Thalassospira indica]OAZ10657.1 hypothetical protein TH15_18900 [Thalassospira profundimaris]